jgi:hypothetical protein
MQDVASGCGAFLGLKANAQQIEIRYILATSKDEGHLVMMIDGKLLYFDGANIAVSSIVGSHFERKWRCQDTDISLSATITDSSYESVSYEGVLVVRYKGQSKSMKVTGSEGC